MRRMFAVPRVLVLLVVACVIGATAARAGDGRLDQCLDVTWHSDDYRDHGKGVTDERADFGNMCAQPIAFTVCYVDVKGKAQGGILTCDFVEEAKPKTKKVISRYIVLGPKYLYEACEMQDATCVGYAKDFFDECNGKFCQY